MDPLLLMTFLFSCGPEYEESKLKLITVVLGTAVNHRRHCNWGDVKNGSPYGILLLAGVLATHRTFCNLLVFEDMVLTRCFCLCITGCSGEIEPPNIDTWEIPFPCLSALMNTMRQSNCERGDHIFGESLLFQDTYRVRHSSRSTSCDGSPAKQV